MNVMATLSKNGKRETITVDGDVFIKSCEVGKWTHVVIESTHTWNQENGESFGMSSGPIQKKLRSKHSGMSAAQNGLDKVYKDVDYFKAIYGRSIITGGEIIEIRR